MNIQPFFVARLYFSKSSLFFISVDSASIPYTEPANSMPKVLCGNPISGTSIWEQGCYIFQFFPLLNCVLCEIIYVKGIKMNSHLKLQMLKQIEGRPKCYQGPRNNSPVSGYCRITRCNVSGTHKITETCRTIILKMNCEFNFFVGAAGNVSFTNCFKVLSWFCVERIECLISLH